jgi:hypothetical protein
MPPSSDETEEESRRREVVNAWISEWTADRKALEIAERERDEARATLADWITDQTGKRGDLVLAFIAAGREIAEGWEGALCVVTPPCGNCKACRYQKALAALDGEGK